MTSDAAGALTPPATRWLAPHLDWLDNRILASSVNIIRPHGRWATVSCIGDDAPPPSTFAFGWLSGLLLYDTPADKGNAARDTWLLTHPDLRLEAAYDAGLLVDEAPVRELLETVTGVDGAIWEGSAPGLMAHLRGLLPNGLDNMRPVRALKRAFPEGLDRQTVVFVPDVGGEAQRTATPPFGLTVVRHPRAWLVAHVQREWTMPEWFLDADDELPSPDPL